MKRADAALRLAPMLLVWAVLGAFFWSFIFLRVTDTDPAHKLVVCVDAAVPGAAELEELLDRACGGDVRMTKVRPFAYAMMDSSALRGADLLIVREENLAAYQDWFAPCPATFAARDEDWLAGGVRCGLFLSGTGQQNAVLRRWIDYSGVDADGGRFYLCFGKQSRHLAGLEGAADDEAPRFASLLLEMGVSSALPEQLQDIAAEDLPAGGFAEAQ